MYLNIKLLVGCLFFSPLICSQSLPDGFVVLTYYIPDLEVELRYANKTNFLGRPVEGYTSEMDGFQRPGMDSRGAIGY